MKVYSREISPWLIWLSLLAVLLIAVGIFFFYTFLRQGVSELIEVVPNDAVFLVEANDHQDWEKSAKRMQPVFNEILVMDAYPAFEDIYHSLGSGNYSATLSAHPGKESLHILYNVQIDKVTFRKLLKKLNIDPNNNIIFEKHKIYTYGTNYKSLKFVYFNHVLSVSDDLEIIKKALIQHRHPKNLLSEKEFKSLYTLSRKNQKQSWILFNNKAYLTYLDNYFTKGALNSLHQLEALSNWSAFQVRTSQNEVFLSGYIPTDKVSSKTPKYELPEKVMPQHVMRYAKCEGNDYAATYILLHGDGDNRQYLILEEDTLHPVLRRLSEENFELLKNLYPDGIYPVDSLLKQSKGFLDPKLATVRQPSWNYCIIRDLYYILAEEKEDLQYLSRCYQNDSFISHNNLYKFTKNCLPSKNLEEYTILNEEKGQIMQDLLSGKGRDSYFGKNLKVFSIYCTSTTDIPSDKDRMIAVNMYLLFDK
ncbi:MAG: hypothetical protein IKR77_01900 [Bacteroidales bacterium]|nr:hypothetical protein [Bacteroidales bacterium]